MSTTATNEPHVEEVLTELKALGDEKRRAFNAKRGAGENQFGVKLGEKLGVYRDYPVSKGCTSPFAPVWINEMVSRQN